MERNIDMTRNYYREESAAVSQSEKAIQYAIQLTISQGPQR